MNCSFLGEVIPCDQFAVTTFNFLIMILLAVAFLIFWIKMLVDVIKTQKEDKVTWIVMLFLFNLPTALLYYFIIVKKRSKK